MIYLYDLYKNSHGASLLLTTRTSCNRLNLPRTSIPLAAFSSSLRSALSLFPPTQWAMAYRPRMPSHRRCRPPPLPPCLCHRPSPPPLYFFASFASHPRSPGVARAIACAAHVTSRPSRAVLAKYRPEAVGCEPYSPPLSCGLYSLSSLSRALAFSRPPTCAFPQI